MHENLKRGAEQIETASDRSFGFVFCGFFAILSAVFWWNDSPKWPWTLGLSVIFLLVALVRPSVLGPLNKLWMKFGALLHKIVNPLVMGLLFYATVTPTALILRIMGKDHLRLKIDATAKSYWIEREPPGPEPSTMRNVY